MPTVTIKKSYPYYEDAVAAWCVDNISPQLYTYPFGSIKLSFGGDGWHVSRRKNCVVIKINDDQLFTLFLLQNNTLQKS